MINGKNLDFYILSDSNEIQNKRCLCHSKGNYKQNSEKIRIGCSLRVNNANCLYFQLLSEFDETQNRRGLYHCKTKYEIIFHET